MSDPFSSTDSPIIRLQQHLDYFTTHSTERNSFDTTLLTNISVISASPSTRSAEFSLIITETMTNGLNTLHGGAASTIMDILTSFTLVTAEAHPISHAATVSRTLSLTFLRPCVIGKKYRIRCWVVAAGKATANTRGEIVEEGTDKVCVLCVHDKAVVYAPKL